MIAFVNNDFIEESAASIGIGDLSIQRGYGIFDFFRTSGDIPLFIDDYLERFFNSASHLHLQPAHKKQDLKEIIAELITRNKAGDSGFRMILTGGYSHDSFEPAFPNLIIIQQPVKLPTKGKFEQGLKVVLHEYLRDLPEAKSINYMMGILAGKKLAEQKADEVLYHKDGYLLEFPRANVFVVTKQKTVVTPAKNVLHGITRKRVLELAAQKYTVEVRDVKIDELKDAAEIFMTSTTKRVMPVLAVDGVKVGDGQPGEITRDLLRSFLQLEEAFCNERLLQNA
jgi:branched-chain amino acid aminotransferase